MTSTAVPFERNADEVGGMIRWDRIEGAARPCQLLRSVSIGKGAFWGAWNEVEGRRSPVFARGGNPDAMRILPWLAIIRVNIWHSLVLRRLDQAQ
jgi:hypothetical protein